MPVECTCRQCGLRFSKPPAAIRDGRGHFCSRKCSSAWKHIAYTGRRGVSLFGADNPNWRGVRAPKSCPICGVTFQSANQTCGVECGHRLQALKISGEGNGGWVNIDTHLLKNYRELVGDRLYFCEHCGLSKQRLLVHHKDRNRSNNKVENLQVLCYSCHTLEHAND